MKPTTIMYIISSIMFAASALLFSNSKIMIINWDLNPDPLFNPTTSLLMDWMSMLFAATVIMISSMIVTFSKSYINDKQYPQYIIILILFITSMIILIFTNNTTLLILGWDMLGLTSFILVMFYQNAKSSASSMITLLSNRLGDTSIILAIAIMSTNNHFTFFMHPSFPTTAHILLMIAAISKSAQFPLSAWLPMAMAAPTPISALVHSSTLVTAGSYIMIRLINYPSTTSTILLMITASTTLMAGMAANWEHDTKKIIALSTLSQIAIITFASSMGMPKLAFFHLITHALFKSTLFMSAGYTIHQTSYQDTRLSLMSKEKSPIPSSSMAITSMALMGLPFMSGFYSKDAIMEMMLSSSHSLYTMLIMMLSISMTSSYTLHLTKITHTTSSNHSNTLLLYPDKRMEIPLIIMTPLSILSGSLLSWITLPPINNPLPFSMKSLTMQMIIIGFLMGMMSHNKMQLSNKMGKPALSIWNLHYLTSTPMLIMMKNMSKSQTTDNTWNEMMPPQKSYQTLNQMFSHMPKQSHLATLSLLLIPIMLLSF